MITFEERREVAEKLRDYGSMNNLGTFETFYARLNGVLFGDTGLERSDADVFKRLADLIDPTCHVNQDK